MIRSVIVLGVSCLLLLLRSIILLTIRRMQSGRMIGRRRCRPATAAATSHSTQRRSEHLPNFSQRLDDGSLTNLGVGGYLLAIQVDLVGLGEVMSFGVGQMIVEDIVGRIVVRGVLLKEGGRQVEECLLGSLVRIGTE